MKRIKSISIGVTILAVVFLLGSAVSMADPIYTYYDNPPFRMYTKEVQSETDVPVDDELYLKHVKYYYRNEDAGSGYGRVYRTDVYDEVEPIALKFDGIDDYINIGDTASLSGLAGVTVEAWVKPDTMKKGRIASKWASSSKEWILVLNDD